MENQTQTKKNKVKLLYIIMLTVGGLIIFGITLFYFLPIPQTVKNVAKEASIKRCFYNEGIGYSAIFSAGDIKHKNFYSSSGNKLCSVGGLTGVTVAEGPCKQSMCFPIYDN